MATKRVRTREGGRGFAAESEVRGAGGKRSGFRLGKDGVDGKRGLWSVAGEEGFNAAAQREEDAGQDGAGGLQHEQP
jgi:hypothetical protein